MRYWNSISNWCELFFGFFFLVLMSFVCLQQPDGINNNSLFGAWCNRWPIPGGLRLYTWSVSDSIAFGWSWRLFGIGTIRSDGNTIRCPSIITDIVEQRRYCVRHFCCIRLYSVPAATIRNKRLRYCILNIIRTYYMIWNIVCSLNGAF